MENSTPIILVRQLHRAKRAGDHYDLRVVIDDKAYSWATKKEMPELGKPHVIFEQPVHDRTYALSKKVVIPAGQYGAGVTTLDFAQKGEAQVTADEYHLDLNNGERFLLKRLNPEKYGEKSWLFARKRTYKEKEELALEKNKYLEKVAGEYRDMGSFRRNLTREAHNIYHPRWDGQVPHSILMKAHKDVIDNTTSDEDGNISSPDIQKYILRRMQARYVNAGLEETYGSEIVRQADSLAHNGASWKGLGAGLLGGVAGSAIGLGASNALGAGKYRPLITAAGGLAGLAGAGYFTAKDALHKGELNADEYLRDNVNPYLQKTASSNSRRSSTGEIVDGAILAAGSAWLGPKVSQETHRFANGAGEKAVNYIAKKSGPVGSEKYYATLRKGVKAQDLLRSAGSLSGKTISTVGGIAGLGMIGHGLYRKATNS